MATRPLQISMDPELLSLIDKEPEVQAQGRSAFIRKAIRLYLDAKRRREIDQQLIEAFAGQADAMLEEVEDLITLQAWPDAEE
jgi:metal-responsive CopG/Arc/MetJ family transcriptional regulator